MACGSIAVGSLLVLASASMTAPQRWVLIFGLTAIAAMAIFPPWIYVYSRPAGVGIRVRDYSSSGAPALRAERPAGYHLLTGIHIPQDQTALAQIFNLPVNDADLTFFSMSIDIQRLVIQIVAVAVLFGAIFLIGTRRREE